MGAQRDEIEFSSGSAVCRAWLFRPAGAGEPRPCIIMAHGLGGTRDAGLEPYAQRFAQAGYAVLLFDYRYFGSSEGEPRQLIRIRAQLQDWASAIACARGLAGVDPERIGLWGTSFSGGHVVVAAANDAGVAAVSAQCPMMDALAAQGLFVRAAGLRNFLRLGALGAADQLRAWLGLGAVYVPLVGRRGDMAWMCSADAAEGYARIAPPSWRNQACARLALTVAAYRPVRYANRVRCPVLIQVCLRDSLASVPAAIRTARRIGTRAELREYDCGHFDIYVGAQFERACAEQLEFFGRTLARGAAAPGSIHASSATSSY
jgi:uncharacterized protein